MSANGEGGPPQVRSERHGEDGCGLGLHQPNSEERATLVVLHQSVSALCCFSCNTSDILDHEVWALGSA